MYVVWYQNNNDSARVVYGRRYRDYLWVTFIRHTDVSTVCGV